MWNNSIFNVVAQYDEYIQAYLASLIVDRGRVVPSDSEVMKGF